MNISEMLSITRQSHFPPMLRAKKHSLDEKYCNLIVNVNLSLASLFQKIQLNQDKLLDEYCEGLRDFLEIANFKEWAYIMLVDKDEVKKITQKCQSDSLATVYLIIQQQINKCYFEHQSQFLVHAWHIYLKLGLVDLRFTEDQIESRFKQMFWGNK